MTYLLQTIEIYQKDGGDRLTKILEDIIGEIKSARNPAKLFESPKIFKFGLLLCITLDSGQTRVSQMFPAKTAEIIIGIHNKNKFLLYSGKEGWSEFNLYVSDNTIGVLHTSRKNYTDEEAQITLTQVNNTEFFTMSVEVSKWGKPNYIYVSKGSAGTVRCNAKEDPGPQGHFKLTPHNDGKCFKITTEAWLEAPLYISQDIFGIARSQKKDTGVRAYIGLTVFKPPAQPTLTSQLTSNVTLAS